MKITATTAVTTTIAATTEDETWAALRGAKAGPRQIV